MPMYRCAFCEHANPLAAKFCNECGSPLHLKPCPQCDAVNGATSKACYMCGAFFPIRGADPEPETARAILDSYIGTPPRLSPDRRPGFAGVMASVLPVFLLGTIAVAAYFVGYAGPVREWTSGLWANLGTSRDVVATPTALTTSGVAPSNATATHADATSVAALKSVSPTSNTSPTDSATAPPNLTGVPVPGNAGGASAPSPAPSITPLTSPQQVSTAEAATPAATAAHTEKKSSTSSRKSARKSKSTTAKKAAPTQTTAAP